MILIGGSVFTSSVSGKIGGPMTLTRLSAGLCSRPLIQKT